MKRLLYLIPVLALLTACHAPKVNNVEFVNDEMARKVDIRIDGTYFTSYIYPNDMEKQVLWPIISA